MDEKEIADQESSHKEASVNQEISMRKKNVVGGAKFFLYFLTVEHSRTHKNGHTVIVHD